jgi:two-component system sensor histidine kinase KdpD
VISAVATGDGIEVTFDDDGPGLPVHGRARLFDKFQRGSEEGATIGAGLGLAICRAILRAHGGEIGTGERPGGGARFIFTLPIRESGS